MLNPVIRYNKNPILTSAEVNRVWDEPQLQTITVHNAGITAFDGEILMLFRSHLRNGISVLGLARSENGFSDWRVDPKPVLVPCSKSDEFAKGKNIAEFIENEQGGLEDARITKIDDTYLITYSAYHASVAHRVRVSLISTTDFKTYLRHGPLLHTDMRNVVIFPEKINGKFYGLFRPNDHTEQHVGGIFKQIQIGSADSWEAGNWQIRRNPVMLQSDGPSSFSDKIGPGAPPIKTKHGWISIFHGVRSTMDGNPYVLGVSLHDLENPERVKVSNIPILFPSGADCIVAADAYVHVPNVVFCCGALRKLNGEIHIYYGGNDTVMNVAVSHEDVLAELCINYGQNPLTGLPLYSFLQSPDG
ncbi:MAG: hypothetical protein ACO1NS_01035 [Daejeonella sp.]|uniref:glycoside hydrolase family 130 protein n=1 Tax=Daejeonella sp. JGW-45 TaxID=3034148 RepID=UPI0023EB08CF|nr:hypothetical protein [Daejeonella sp. JGW-45]